MVIKEEKCWGGINQEFGINRRTVLYIKWINNKDLYSTGFHFSFRSLEKEMATHSSVFAWRIPGTGEPGGLPP